MTTPADIRNLCWRDIQGQVQGNRELVYKALLATGPSSTAVLALKMEWSVLNVRPRVHELLKLGLVELVGKEGHEGIYAAVPLVLARARFEAAHPQPKPEQILMGAVQ